MSNSSLKYAGLALVVAATFGCGTTATAPPPVVEASDPIARDAPARADTGSSDDATRALLARADQANRARDHQTEVAYLERAVRLAPRDAALWIRLSQAHLAADNLPVAAQYARKAIALAGEGTELGRSAWLTLADVREAEGKADEAATLRRRHSTGRG